MIDARKYLSSIRASEMQVQLKKRQVKDLQDRLTSLSVPPDKEVVAHTPNVSIMADTVALIVDMQAEIERQSAESILMEGQAYILLNMLNPEYSSLLIEHYIKGKRITEISKELHLEPRWTKKKIASALTEFQILLDQQKDTLKTPQKHSEDTPKTL